MRLNFGTLLGDVLDSQQASQFFKIAIFDNRNIEHTF